LRGPAEVHHILLLGGTSEAASMASRLHASNIAVTTSLAGRTREPKPVDGKVRTGGFGGPEGLAAYIQENQITLLVDMTHPFATRISQNARKASQIAGIPVLHWQRPGWTKAEGDNWIEVPDIPAAIAAIPANARALLALGSQHIAPFAVRADVRFLVRMIDPPAAPLSLPDHEILLAKPGSVEEEFALLREKKITCIVCRNSGGKASYAKIAAARLLNLPVIMISRVENTTASVFLDTFEQQILSAVAEGAEKS
jgi:precorrin-6A/cobalt-precorrin-6A reductase